MSQRLGRFGLAVVLAGLPLLVDPQSPTGANNGPVAYVEAPPRAKPEPGKEQFPGRGTIKVTRADGSGTTEMSGLGKHDVETVEYSPDGKWIAWLSTRRGAKSDHRADGIYVASSDGSGARQVARSSWTNDFGWSADSTSIVYMDVTSGVYGVPADGSRDPKLLHDTPESGGVFGGFTSSPDGFTWVFEHDVWGANGPDVTVQELWRMNADGQGAAPLFPKRLAPRWAGEPDLSPDGTQLVFVSQEVGRDTVVVAPFGTTNFRTILRAKRDQWVDGPTWSADGKFVVVGVGADDYRAPTKLFTINAATGKRSVLRRRATGSVSQPTWRALP